MGEVPKKRYEIYEKLSESVSKAQGNRMKDGEKTAGVTESRPTAWKR